MTRQLVRFVILYHIILGDTGIYSPESNFANQHVVVFLANFNFFLSSKAKSSGNFLSLLLAPDERTKAKNGTAATATAMAATRRPFLR